MEPARCWWPPSQAAVFSGWRRLQRLAALDGASCKVVWQSEWKPRGHETFITQRGAAIEDGKLVRGTGDGYLLALDTKTGQALWSRHIAKPSEGLFHQHAAADLRGPRCAAGRIWLHQSVAGTNNAPSRGAADLGEIRGVPCRDLVERRVALAAIIVIDVQPVRAVAGGGAQLRLCRTSGVQLRLVGPAACGPQAASKMAATIPNTEAWVLLPIAFPSCLSAGAAAYP